MSEVQHIVSEAFAYLVKAGELKRDGGVWTSLEWNSRENAITEEHLAPACDYCVKGKLGCILQSQQPRDFIAVHNEIGKKCHVVRKYMTGYVREPYRILYQDNPNVRLGPSRVLFSAPMFCECISIQRRVCLYLLHKL